MYDAVGLAGAWSCSLLGMALIALSQPRHWDTVAAGGEAGTEPPGAGALGLAGRLLSLLVSLVMAVASQGAALGAIFWVMALCAAALAVAFTLAWRPHWLRPLAWLLRRAAGLKAPRA